LLISKGNREQARGKRQEARGKRQEARGKRQEARGKRQEARGTTNNCTGEAFGELFLAMTDNLSSKCFAPTNKSRFQIGNNTSVFQLNHLC